MRVAVIGAGAAGLAAARELRREGHAPVVFERGGGVGGTWIYDEPRDREGGGHYHHSSLYASLRTNLPREVMGFLDFPFAAAALPESVDPRRFPRHEEVLRYIQEFARRFELYDLVRFRTEVTAMTAAAGGSVKNQMSQSHGGGGGCWRVRWRKLFVADDADAADAEEEEGEEPFDAVVVCNGHYTEPRIADIPGIDAWPGKQMHSRSYRVPDPFVDQASRPPQPVAALHGVARHRGRRRRLPGRHLRQSRRHHALHRLQVQLPLPLRRRRRRRQRRRRLRPQQPHPPAVQARLRAAAGAAPRLHRAALQGHPVPAGSAPGQLGRRSAVGEDPAAVGGGDDGGGGGPLLGDGGRRVARPVHALLEAQPVRVRRVAGGAVRPRRRRGVEEGDVRCREQEEGGLPGDVPRAVGRSSSAGTSISGLPKVHPLVVIITKFSSYSSPSPFR